MAVSEGLGVFSYSPLGGGYLTGKYLNERSGESRFDKSEMYQKRYEDEQNLKATQAFLNFAKENNYDPVSLAIAWVGSNPGITAPIIGARNIEQLKPALGSLDIEMSTALRDELSSFSLTPALANDRAEERKSGNKKLY
jgi:aryl-alcohol dehydrogenase-like predicted oxidoreductase